MIKCLPDSEWYPNGSESVLCQLPFTLDEVEIKLGIAFTRSQVHHQESAHLVLQLEGYVLRLEAQPPDGPVRVSVRGDVQEPGRCLPIVCEALGIKVAQLPWVSADLQARPWGLCRLDDNGNRVAMWYFREREVAESVARDYAARGHKQTYYVENSLYPLR